MPRKARLDAPGALHHIVVRGIERRKIFYDDNDRDDFLERLSAILGESRAACYLLPPLWDGIGNSSRKRLGGASGASYATEPTDS
jgi:hypothetical protein